MNAKKRRRLYFAAALVAAGGVLAVAIVYGLGNNVHLFLQPQRHGRQACEPGRRLPHRRAGGKGQRPSWRRRRCALSSSPTASAPCRSIINGVLPALFREGQGVVATGALNAGGTFDATEVLAKHDEKYMPPEVVAALKRSGRWKEGGE